MNSRNEKSCLCAAKMTLQEAWATLGTRTILNRALTETVSVQARLRCESDVKLYVVALA